MGKKFISLFLSAIMIATVLSFSIPKETVVKSASTSTLIKPPANTHPRVLFTKNDIQSIKDSAKTNQNINAYDKLYSYYKEVVLSNFSADCKGKYDGIVELDGQMHDIMINYPLYNDVEAVSIGLSKDATVLPMGEYYIKTPVVFYGSSITQGGCASRPGISYEAILSREMDFDYVNLGFSGAAYGEPQIAEYIAKMRMSCFVLDYDHNAPDIVHLEATHEPFYRIIRKYQPHLPIVISSAPNARIAEPEWENRRSLIRENYNRFTSEGDKNLWYVDGNTLWGKDGWDNCTVDACHPNDLGFWRMARAFAPVLKEILFQ